MNKVKHEKSTVFVEDEQTTVGYDKYIGELEKSVNKESK